MKRWLLFLGCSLLGVATIVSGLLVPAHLKSVDVSVVAHAGRTTPGVVEQGLALVEEQRLGPAGMLLQYAQAAGLAGREKLGLSVGNLALRDAGVLFWGQQEKALEYIFARNTEKEPEPITAFIIRPEQLVRALEQLRDSRIPAVFELMRSRSLTNTVLFAPSRSNAGQAFDAAVALTGLLLEANRVSAGFSNEVYHLAARANNGLGSQRYEQALLDVLSLGQRLNWAQLASFIGPVPDAETLRLLTQIVRRNEGRLPLVFTAVLLSGQPGPLVDYLMSYSSSGMEDVSESLRYGTGGVRELLSRKERLYLSPFPARLAVDLAWHSHGVALALRWALLLGGGFLLAAAVHYGRRVPDLEEPLQVRGFHVAREFLFGLGFLVVVLVVTEPFLTQESQRVEFPFRLRLPMVTGAEAAFNTSATATFMNQISFSLLTLLLFFVLQALIYMACMIKLAEIRRQSISPRMKLRLLDNEDHLFDAGLYLGFVGTIISLILVSLGVIKPSLMAAYSSTSFGIIFVSFFKIFNLRPLRRKLLLEAEMLTPEMAPSAVATSGGRVS